MKILSLNVRGLGAVPKKVALKWLLATTSPTVLLLQETMSKGKKAEEAVKECVKGWGMTNNDADGHLGGTLTAWSPALNLISVHRFGTVVGTKLEDSETGKHFMILNIYGSFYDRKTFWERLEGSGAMDLPDLILGGNLNLTLTNNEVWGKIVSSDSLGPFLVIFFSRMV